MCIRDSRRSKNTGDDSADDDKGHDNRQNPVFYCRQPLPVGNPFIPLYSQAPGIKISDDRNAESDDETRNNTGHKAFAD